MVTAGPTYEPFDAVRFIGNYSSGKMGYALAEQLADAGAFVKLISGPVSLQLTHKNIDVIRVQTAREMLKSCLSEFRKSHGAILCAAVADFRPAKPVTHKIKTTGASLMIELEPNPDIAAELGRIRRADQFLAGFALETDNELTNAEKKLIKKNFDFIVLNSLREPGSGFHTDTNKITIIGKSNDAHSFDLASKKVAASNIISYLAQIISPSTGHQKNKKKNNAP